MFVDKQFLIIDGYNVLHSYGRMPPENRARHGDLQRAREDLLKRLRRHLSTEELQRTTVIFDSDHSGLPTRSDDTDLIVEYASDHASADDRIIQLIRQHSAPRQLLVVSSDHRIQRAAEARRARVVDSDVWIDQLPERNPGRRDDSRTDETDPANTEKPRASAEDTAWWLELMGLNEPGESQPTPDQEIFPPGYAEDLPDDDQDTP